jgi:hypothetical protein
VFQVLILVACLENVLEQWDQGTINKEQVSRYIKETSLEQINHRGAQNNVVSAYVLLFFSPFLFSLIFALVVVFCDFSFF